MLFLPLHVITRPKDLRFSQTFSSLPSIQLILISSSFDRELILNYGWLRNVRKIVSVFFVHLRLLTSINIWLDMKKVQFTRLWLETLQYLCIMFAMFHSMALFSLSMVPTILNFTSNFNVTFSVTIQQPVPGEGIKMFIAFKVETKLL